MTAARTITAATGLTVLAYGVLRLLDLGWANLAATATWLVGAVVVHDGLLATTTLAVCALGALVLPPRARGPAAGALLVLGSLTLMAVPVLGRFGARPDNPTLLDRPYAAGWLAVAAVVLVAAAGIAVVRRREGGHGG